MKRGYTLIELLIVVVIMIILVAITLPIAKKVMEGTRAREASRQLQAYFAMAQARAAQTGRPCGVEFVSVEALGLSGVYQTTQCYLSEVPPSYVGSMLDARGIFRIEPSGQAEFVPLVTAFLVDANGDGVPDNDANGDRIPDEADTNNDGRWDENAAERSMLSAILDANEAIAIQLDHSGRWYACLHDSGRFRLLETTVTPMPKQFNNAQHGGFAFQVRRSPKRFGSPMEISGGTTVDLAYSGEGTAGRQFHAATQRLTIMFQPGGNVMAYWMDALPSNPQIALGTLHLLVGRVDKLSSPAGSDWGNRERSNLADPESIWVSIGRNGHVGTADNLPDSTASTLTDLVLSARRSATGREQMSGR